MRSTAHPHVASRRLTSGVAGLLVGGFVFATLSLGSVAGAPAATADDALAVTVTAATYDPDVKTSPFPDLAVTVSQTTGLIAQGIEISWTGGKPSTPPTGDIGGENFLQFAQCWGDDPDHPGRPDRTTCQYGAFETRGATREGNRPWETFLDETGEERTAIAPQDEKYSVPGEGSLNPAYTSIPFRSATGETIANVVDNKRVGDTNVNSNRFFTAYTSNEIPWAGSGADGTGRTKFEVQTVTQSQGLGCGARVAGAADPDKGASCWLVAIPRGTADVGERGIIASGLNWDTWKHHLAVKLDFRSLGLNCALGAAERQLAGSELIATAVGSWQPTLCTAEGGSVYTMLKSTESDALAAANRPDVTAAPLALTSEPFVGEQADSLAYAPIGITALTVAFAIDRFPKQDGSPSPEYLERTRLPFEAMNLTPRLIAKLLTASYRDALPVLADRSHLGDNPRNLLFDPDFLAINDEEWAAQAIAGIGVSDILLPQGRSDAALQLWRYVMADADARAFLSGEGDPWGMVVNPNSSTNAEANPSGVGAVYPRDNFPKADPVTVPAVPGGAAEVNLVTWRPYTNDLDASGYFALRGDGQVLGPWDATANPPRFARSKRDLPGTQSVIALTDSAAVGKYQLLTAALRNPAGQFVAPTTEAMTAAAAAMIPSSAQPQVRSFDVASAEAVAATTAYPLTMAVYAAANPAMGDAVLRASYADFIRFAATTGQTPGVQIGELPPGYAPLPTGWRDQAVTAAAWIQSGAAPASGSVDSPASGVPRAATAPASGGGSYAAPAAAPAAAADPLPTGAAAGALSGAVTPADPELAGVQVALPLSMLAGIASAAVVLFLPRLNRRL